MEEGAEEHVEHTANGASCFGSYVTSTALNFVTNGQQSRILKFHRIESAVRILRCRFRSQEHDLPRQSIAHRDNRYLYPGRKFA